MKRKSMKIVFLFFGIMWNNQWCDFLSSEDCLNWTRKCLVSQTYEKYNICAKYDTFSVRWPALHSHGYIITRGSVLRNALLAANTLKPTYQSLQNNSGWRERNKLPFNGSQTTEHLGRWYRNSPNVTTLGGHSQMETNSSEGFCGSSFFKTIVESYKFSAA